MKLQSITIKNVKSFREAVTFEPHKEFNVLIGSNAYTLIGGLKKEQTWAPERDLIKKSLRLD